MTMTDDRPKIPITVVSETPFALKVRRESGGISVWIPRERVDLDTFTVASKHWSSAESSTRRMYGDIQEGRDRVQRLQKGNLS